MTKRVSEILYEMAAEEGFYFLDIERFCKKNKDEIQKLNTIFDTDDDRNDEIMDVAHYLISKTFDDFENYEKPENFEDDKNLVLAGLIENQSFFSMCWNYMLMEKHKVSIVPKKKEENNSNEHINNLILSLQKRNGRFQSSINHLSYYYPKQKAIAGTTGLKNITNIPVNPIGHIETQGDEDNKVLLFVFFLKEEYQNLKFEVSIDFEVGDSEKYTAKILKEDSNKTEISSEPIFNIDITNGVRITTISWKQL